MNITPNNLASSTGPKRVAGLHISGASAAKSSLVVLSREDFGKTIAICKVYEKIGAIGATYADERLLGILESQWPLQAVFVDCPLSVPPCVSCQRPVCPGVVSCEDVSVAYMLAVGRRQATKRNSRSKLTNPQAQRLWDVLHWSANENAPPEPTYTASRGPLTTRARTLQKRLNQKLGGLQLQETSIPLALFTIAKFLGLGEKIWSEYRNFSRGADLRRQVMENFIQLGWLREPEQDVIESIALSLENFHAWLAAWMASLFVRNCVHEIPESFVTGEGWVFLPDCQRL